MARRAKGHFWTNLMWAAKNNGANISWQGANSYCENYRGGGYTDWRIPTLDELAELYDYSITNNGLHITGLIKITASSRASDIHGTDVPYFSFYNGRRYSGYLSVEYFYARALPVRSAK